MQSKEIKRIKRAIRRIKRINKENVRLFNYIKFKIKILDKELTSKKKWATMYPKLIGDGRAKLKALEEKLFFDFPMVEANKNGNKTGT